MRDQVRAYAVEALASPDGVLVVDETGFVKKGLRSAGVQRGVLGHRGQDRELPTGRVPRLCRSSWPSVDRSGVVSAGIMDRRP
ncbi:transposase [Nocardia abscessus]|nr:transposase [Nocardia abscessus]